MPKTITVQATIHPFVLYYLNPETKEISSVLKISKLEISTVVYEGKCNCGKNYIDETGRNVTIRCDENSDIVRH